MQYSKAFLGQSTLLPIPLPPKKFLSRFTLISRMVLGVGKKSEIRLKSEDSVPCSICNGHKGQGQSFIEGQMSSHGGPIFPLHHVHIKLRME